MNISALIRNASRLGIIALAATGALMAQRTVTVSVAGNELTATGSATVVLASQGDENALGFTMTFDPAVLRFESVTNGADVGGATVHVNASQSASGRIGLALALPSAWSFPAGNRALVVLNFTVHAPSRTSTVVGFADAPIAREVSDPQARAMPAQFSGVTVAAGPTPRI